MPEPIYVRGALETPSSPAAVWGSGALRIDFIGGPYRITGLDGVQLAHLQRHFGERGVIGAAAQDAPVELTVRRIDADRFKPIHAYGGWEYNGFDFDYAPGRVVTAGLGMLAELRLGPGVRGTLWTPLSDHHWFPGIVFENFFRLVVAYRLLALGGALLHSSGTLDPTGWARLFLGPSGAGKSTLAGLLQSQGHRVLSDDLNAVLPAGDGFRVQCVPFAGTLATFGNPGASHPLAGCYRIIKAQEERVRPAGGAGALALLLSCSPFINRDPLRSDALIANLTRLAAGVAQKELSFSLTGAVAQLLEMETAGAALPAADAAD